MDRIISLDPARAASVAIIPMAAAYDWQSESVAFATRVMAQMAKAMGLTYEQMATDYQRCARREEKIEQATRLIVRAALIAARGGRGYDRKLKRARRLAREGGEASLVWHHQIYHWTFRRERARLRASHVFSAWLKERH